MSPAYEAFAGMLVSLFLATARLSVALTITPFFGSATGLSRRAFLIATLGIAVPMLMPQAMQMPTSAVEAAALCIKEVLLGMLLAIPASLVFWAILSAGELIDLQRGTTAASVFNPFFGAIASPTSNLLIRFSSIIFFVGGGFFTFLSAIMASYEVYPINELLPNFGAGAPAAITEMLSQYFALTVLYAAPFLIAFLFVDVGLGLMNRFVPQLNVFFFALPIKSGLTFLLLIFYTGVLVTILNDGPFTEHTLLTFLRLLFP